MKPLCLLAVSFLTFSMQSAAKGTAASSVPQQEVDGRIYFPFNLSSINTQIISEEDTPKVCPAMSEFEKEGSVTSYSDVIHPNDALYYDCLKKILPATIGEEINILLAAAKQCSLSDNRCQDAIFERTEDLRKLERHLPYHVGTSAKKVTPSPSDLDVQRTVYDNVDAIHLGLFQIDQALIASEQRWKVAQRKSNDIIRSAQARLRAAKLMHTSYELGNGKLPQ